jgi:kynureninase
MSQCFKIHKLKIRIGDACESDDMQMLSSVWNETGYHFDVCRITNCVHSKIR